MQNHEQHNQAAGLNLADIYYVLFRHKWMIIILSAAGLIAAAVVWKLDKRKTVFQSEAKLFIKYVVEQKLPTSAPGADPQLKFSDPGASIMGSEAEIIKSLDVADQVVSAIGAEKILGADVGEGPESNKDRADRAAVRLQQSLLLDSPPHSDILRIAFRHPDARIVQPVLEQLIKAYKSKHFEIHRSGGAFEEVLLGQTLELQTQLTNTEWQLRSAKTNAGLTSVEDAKKSYNEEISKTREVLFNTEVELAEHQAKLHARQKLMSASSQVSTNQSDGEVPAAKVEAYRTLRGRLEFFHRREQELLTQFTEESSMVRNVRAQIASAEEARKTLEGEYPKLSQIQRQSSQPGAAPQDWSDEVIQIYALQVKTNVLSDHLDKLTAYVHSVDEVEPAITELQRKKELEEIKFRHFSTSLEQSRFDGLLNQGKSLNISVAQEASPPLRVPSKLTKTLGMIIGGGVFGSIALAFLIEMFLTTSVRRPGEVETRLRLPLFLTIPRMDHESHPRSLLGKKFPFLRIPWVQRKHRPALPETSEPSPTPATNQESGLEPYHSNGLTTYYEALRDRLVTYFEINDLRHKPKLIAVTGCGKGAGATTIATGLAASLSETGDGNVLVVDMTSEQGAAHPFFKGKRSTSLADALTNDKREGALVQGTLYAAAGRGNGDQLPSIMPRRFNSLIPKLKASDYDYIIFDMPPVSQISLTPRLAGFMDMVLLVIESEKTDRDVVKRATSMLAESKATVRAILNKNHSYVPKRLLEEV